MHRQSLPGSENEALCRAMWDIHGDNIFLGFVIGITPEDFFVDNSREYQSSLVRNYSANVFGMDYTTS